MALPTTRIYLRSPYFLSLSRANLAEIYIDLYIYTGTLTTDKPAGPQYTLKATAFDDFAQIEISEFVRDYVEINFNGTYEQNSVWVEWELSYADDGDTSLTLSSTGTAIATEGYNYPEQGYNASPVPYRAMTNDYILVPENGLFRIPVWQDFLDSYIIARGGYQIYDSGTLTTQEETANTFVYITNVGYQYSNADRIILKYNNGQNDEVINIKYFCERPDTIKCTFLNRFGALQDLYFYGSTSYTLNTTSSEYKRNILDGASYDTDRHQINVHQKNGRASMTCNSNFYPEDSNASFQELFLSEWVWLTMREDALSNPGTTIGVGTNEVTFPVNLRTASNKFKKRLTDGLISYTCDFEFAMDRINSIR